MVKLLLQHGAEPCPMALTEAARSFDTEMVCTLIKLSWL